MTGGGRRRGEGAGRDTAAGERVRLVPDERGGVSVLVDGAPQSHVHPGDPHLLVFEYVAHLALVLRTVTPPPPAPLAVTHVGGAAMTLARWVEAVRPGSPQVVLEPDAALTELVRRELPLPRRHRIRVRPVDGAGGTAALRAASADAVVVDAFAGGRVPAELVTGEYLTDVARVLRPGGTLLMNLTDEPGLRWVSRVLATLAAVRGDRDGTSYGEPVLVATGEVLKGRRFGNVVLAATRAGGAPLDVAALAREVAREALPTGLRRGPDVTRMARSARPLTAADPEPSPTPPGDAWRRT